MRTIKDVKRTFLVRLESNLHARIRDEATRDRMSMNDWIVKAIRESLRKSVDKPA